MTQAPIHPRHKDEAAKAAGVPYCNLLIYSNELTRSVYSHAQTLANLEAMRDELNEAYAGQVQRDIENEAKGKALAEIDRIAVAGQWGQNDMGSLFEVAAIAAPYRASDPVAEALVTFGQMPGSNWDVCPPEVRAETLKKAFAAHGLEIIKRGDG